jgi:hypothetical protein
MVMIMLECRPIRQSHFYFYLEIDYEKEHVTALNYRHRKFEQYERKLSRKSSIQA